MTESVTDLETVSFDALGLVDNTATSYEDFANALTALRNHKRGAQWAIYDLLLQAEHKRGEEWAQLLDAADSTVANGMSAARYYPRNLRGLQYASGAYVPIGHYMSARGFDVPVEIAHAILSAHAQGVAWQGQDVSDRAGIRAARERWQIEHIPGFSKPSPMKAQRLIEWGDGEETAAAILFDPDAQDSEIESAINALRNTLGENRLRAIALMMLGE